MCNKKDLKNKAVKIQGKNYVLVADRILFFNNNFPKGAIKTEIISVPGDPKIIYRASVYPDASDAERVFIGHAQETEGQGYINKNSATENCETSAVGRALAMMGIGVIDSVASADEVYSAKFKSSQPVQAPQKQTKSSNDTKPQEAPKNKSFICEECGIVISPVVANFSKTKYKKYLCRNCQINYK